MPPRGSSRRICALTDGANVWLASHQQLANELGTARNVVSRHLREFQHRGWILQERGRINTPLLTGAALFGIGWGIGGVCPGPAWTALAIGAPGTLVFVPSMLLGLGAGRYLRSLPAITRSTGP